MARHTRLCIGRDGAGGRVETTVVRVDGQEVLVGRRVGHVDVVVWLVGREGDELELLCL